jgi:uncharacterized membrane protein YidH (DUF202 family)
VTHANKKVEGLDAPRRADLVFDQIQLVLAEKRTALSTLRTGIAVFALPISAFSVLIVTSRYYEAARVLHWLLPLLALNIGLVVLGCYLITLAVFRIRRYDRRILDLKQKHAELALLVD